MAYLIDISRIFLGLVFLCSAVTKMRSVTSFNAFRVAVAQLAPALSDWTMPVSVLVVAAEVAVIVGLVVPQTVVAGFVLATVLLLAFTAGLIGTLRRKVNASCRCFGGGGSDSVAPRHVVRNLVLLTTALAGLAARFVVIDEGLPEPPGLLLSAGVAAILALLTVALDDLVGLFRPAGEKGARR